MSIKNPTIANQVVISDDPFLAAMLSAQLGRNGVYLPVLDGPRIARRDADAEVIRRTNALARVAPRTIVLAGVAEDAARMLEDKLPKSRLLRIAAGDQLPEELSVTARKVETLIWGRENLALGLLTALRSNRKIEFGDRDSSTEPIPTNSGHIVVLEAGEPLSEIIAANYAFSLGAGLHVIPEIDEDQADWLEERFISLQEPTDESPTQKLRSIKSELRSLSGDIEIPKGSSLTFITRSLPLGFAFPDVPSTHLFLYPDLGISIVNGFTAENRKESIGVAATVDPGHVEAQELQEVSRLLRPRRVLIRSLKGRNANISDVDSFVRYFPYDLLIFATHCGDPKGERNTYEFLDSEGRARRLTVDTAHSFGHSHEDDMIKVSQYFRFHSLDGVRWKDPSHWSKEFVGKSIVNWLDYLQGTDAFLPAEREDIPRVIGTGALSMFDGNYVCAPESIGCNGTPIILNNACSSWFRLAHRLTFASARAYIGSLIEITDSEAFAVTTRLLGKHVGKSLPHALWSSQNEAFGDSIRRPYVATGVYTQKLHFRRHDALGETIKKLHGERMHWLGRLARHKKSDQEARQMREAARFCRSELSLISKHWPERSI